MNSLAPFSTVLFASEFSTLRSGRRSILPFNKWHGKRSQTLLKSPRQHLFHIYWSTWTELSLKKSVLVIFKILGLFVNTLTADDKYSLLNRNNLRQPIQMQLSQKQKLFFNFFWIFKITLKFWTFSKQRWPS